MPQTFRFWLVSAAALLGVGITLALGQWQLGRAAEKQALQTAIDGQGRLAPLTQTDVSDSTLLADVVHRRATLQGHWLREATVYLDNRQMAARQGFFVLTPLRLSGSNTLLMVQRGWVPRDFTDRNRLPAVRTPEGEVRITVRIAPPPSRLYDFQGAPTGAIRQNIDLTAYAAETRLPLLTQLSALELTPDAGTASDGLLRNWPAFNTGIDKHHGYAFQWFGLSGLIALLYVWFQIIQPRRQRHAPL